MPVLRLVLAAVWLVKGMPLALIPIVAIAWLARRHHKQAKLQDLCARRIEEALLA